MEIIIQFPQKTKAPEPAHTLKGSQLNSLVDCEEFTFVVIYY